MAKLILSKSLLVGFALLILLSPVTIIAEQENGKYCVEKNYLPVVKTLRMVVTAYSPNSWETDDTPTVTASNKDVQWGYVANNGLAFGTRIRIPELYGNTVFIVEDRMHSRKGKYHLDIFMEETAKAKEFGAKWGVDVEVLGS